MLGTDPRQAWSAKRLVNQLAQLETRTSDEVVVEDISVGDVFSPQIEQSPHSVGVLR